MMVARDGVFLDVEQVERMLVAERRPTVDVVQGTAKRQTKPRGKLKPVG